MKGAQRTTVLILGLLVSLTAAFLAPARGQVALDLSGSNGGHLIVGYDSRTCDASLEGAIRYNSGATTPYTPIGVHFDGTNDYSTRGGNLNGVVDGQKGTFSGWVKMGPGTDGSSIRILSGGGSDNFNVMRASGDRFRVILENSAGTNIGSIYQTAFAATEAGGWYHVLASWDVGNGLSHMYVNDVEDCSTCPPSPTAQLVDYVSGPDWGVGAYPNGAGKFNGDMADIWLDLDLYIDLDVESNRRKFISVSGLPMYLGSDGSIPTGEAPDIFLSGDTVTFHSNRGTGGGFTENGALSDATQDPPTGTGGPALLQVCDGSAWQDF